MAGNISSTPACSFVRRLREAHRVGEVGLVGFLDLGQFLLHGDLDAEFRQVRE
jgi:hypothetical protein